MTWKEIFKNIYVSDTGLIKSTRRNRDGIILKTTISNSGYELASFLVDGKMKSFNVHRLVAMAFIPNPNNLPIINHKNEIKTDNRVENLEWCTYKYNSNYGTITRRWAFEQKVINIVDEILHPQYENINPQYENIIHIPSECELSGSHRIWIEQHKYSVEKDGEVYFFDNITDLGNFLGKTPARICQAIKKGIPIKKKIIVKKEEIF